MCNILISESIPKRCAVRNTSRLRFMCVTDVLESLAVPCIH